jgi:RNA 2',3'-cyclic 3'-phosphodiesterase
MRAFIAIVPPASVTNGLLKLGADIRTISPVLRCEPAVKLHFTLEFLGEKQEQWLEACKGELVKIASATPPFPVVLQRLGFFPGKIHPRIIWAGSAPVENPRLCAFTASIKEACTRLGHLGDQKAFQPHITLSRVKTHLSPDDIERIAALGFEPSVFTCREICVVRSELHAHGSDYSTLYTIPLLHPTSF